MEIGPRTRFSQQREAAEHLEPFFILFLYQLL